MSISAKLWAMVVLMVASTSAQAYQVRTTRDVPYGSDPAERLDICRPIRAPTPAPAFIVIHGTGWVGGDKSDLFPADWCNHLASKGYTAFSINYRLVTGYEPGVPLPNSNESNTFPTPLNDAQLAVRWVRSNARRYGVDTSLVCALGFSAGGHLATFLGALKTIYPGDVAGQLANISPGVACVSAVSAPTDLTVAITGPPNDDDYVYVKFLVNAEATIENWDLYQAASPRYSASPSSAPMSLVQGTQDQIVFPDQASTMSATLEANGVPTQILWYDGGHLSIGVQIYDIIDQSITWALANARPVANRTGSDSGGVRR